jgi:hypothetical protein
VSVADLPPAVVAAGAVTSGAKIEAHAASPLAIVGALAAWASARDIDLPDLEVSRPTLEDIYLQLTRDT